LRVRSVRIIFLKEMLETIRDKRTIMVMILGPVLIYPILILAFSQMHTMQEARLSRQKTTVYLHEKKEWPELKKALSEEPDLRILPTDKQRLEDDKAVLVEFDGRRAKETDGDVPRIAVTYRQTDVHSERGKERVLAALEKYAREATKEKVDLKEDERYVYPVILEEKNLSTRADQIRFILAMSLPMILVLMTVAGAIYPAIDTTAGEKERGTIETILASPAGRDEIVYGKFLSVFVICMVTGLLNLGAMSLTFVYVLRAFAEPIINWTSVLLVLVSLVPLAILFSAVMMAVSTYARTFREAQNYVTPVYLVCLLPAMVSMQRGFELNDFLCLLPVVNISLFFREVMEGVYRGRHIILVFASTSLYAAAALRGAVRLFRDENALFSLEKPFALFVRRRFLKAKPAPSLGEAVFLCAIVFVFYNYGSSGLVGFAGEPSSFLWGTMLSEWLFILLPVLLFARYLKVSFRQTFSLGRLRAVHLPGTFLLFAGSFFLVLELVFLQRDLVPVSEEFVSRVSSGVKDGSFLLVLLALALSPAVCEEMMFRGFVLAGMNRLAPWGRILVNGVLFGVYHILFFRMLPTAFLGVVIAFIVVNCRSIFPGMLFHFVNNCVGLVLIRYGDEVASSLKRLRLGGVAARWLKGEAHVPWQLLIVSAVVLAAGAAVLLLASHRREQAAARTRPPGTGPCSDISAQEIEKG